MAWGDVCDPDCEDNDALEFSLSPSLSPNRVQEVSENFVEPVVFADENLRPAPEAYGASESEDLLADTCGSLSPGGQERHSSPSYSELLDVVTRAVDKLGLDWEADATQSQSKLDNCFLTSRAPSQPHKLLPFFPDIHQEVSRSWKQPFSARITNAAAVDFATITDMAGRGYAPMPPVEDTLAEHLAPNSAAAWKSRPLLPSKPCRITSHLVSSGNLIQLQVRRQPCSTRWRCFRPTRRSY